MSTTYLALPSPAKLNLFLHINSRRADNYHQLQTLYQLIDYSDQLQFSLNHSSPHISVRATNLSIEPTTNLVYQAAKLLQHHSQSRLGADIWLDKRLPVGGGLGGGSSNAATTLLALNALWQARLSLAQLAQLAIQLGADVPLFVWGQSAWGEGLGEQLTPLALGKAWYLIVQPDCQVTTATIFNHPDLPRQTAPLAPDDWCWENTGNDCQALVRKAYKAVDKALTFVENIAPVSARMTGTGACVFAQFNSRQAAMAAYNQLPATMQAVVVQGVDKSPLHRSLADISAMA
jgi:4-diphosphocytidyl-2-C-methyl-D-erythritol kinase